MNFKKSTSIQRKSEDYCKSNNIELEILPSINLWSVWITFPDGRDYIYSDKLEEREAEISYWDAAEYAASFFWEEMNSLKLEIPVPKMVPRVLKVPVVPKVPTVPKRLIVPVALKVPTLN